MDATTAPDTKKIRSPLRAQKRLCNLSVALILIFVFLAFTLGVLFWKTRANALHQAEINGANLAWVLESRLDATLRRIDANLENLAHSVSSPEHNHLLMNRQTGQDYLSRYEQKFPEVRGIQVFDAVGQLLYSSRETQAFTIADREHFRRLRDMPSTKLEFSEVLFARTDGKPAIAAARALRDAKGQFLGIISPNCSTL